MAPSTLPAQRTIPAIDALRGIAILWVFLFHCLGPAFGRSQLPWGEWLRSADMPLSFVMLMPITLGWAGVALFFVVSGFCIHLSFSGGSGNTATFLVRRWFRILPAYVFALLLFATVLPGTRLSFDGVRDWAQFGSHLLLIHNLDARTFFGINPAFWSIAVEAQLYLLYPLLLALVSRCGWRSTLMLLGGVELALRAIAGVSSMGPAIEPAWLTYGSPFYYWYSWAIGAALADAFVHRRPLPFVRSSPLLWASLAIGTTMVKPLAPFSFLCFALLTVSVLARLLSREAQPSGGLVQAHLRKLGTFSYSFYLLHQPLLAVPIGVMQGIGIALHPLAAFAVCAGTYPLILAASAGLYWCCERPGIALGRSVIERMSRPPEAVGLRV